MNEIEAEQAEAFPAVSVAVAENCAVVPGGTMTMIPGELSSAEVPIAAGDPEHPVPLKIEIRAPASPKPTILGCPSLAGEAGEVVIRSGGAGACPSST